MISVGIPAYNEEKSIKRTILNILPQLSYNDELIVVASGCADKTIEKVKEIFDQRIRLIKQKERKGKIAGTNIILKESRGEIIVLIDADVIVEKHGIKKLVNDLKDKKVGAACAKVENYQEKTFFDKVQGAGWIGLNEQKIRENKRQEFYALNGYLMAVKKGIINKLDKNFLLDDALLGWTIKQKGYRLIYDPDVKVYVKAAQNFSDFVKQKKRNRIGWWQMNKLGMPITHRRNIKQIKFVFKNFYAFFYILFDLYVWTKAYVDFKQEKLDWEKIKSSKI